MDNSNSSIEQQIKVQQAFLKAKAKYAEKEAERKKAFAEKAAAAAEVRRKMKAERAVRDAAEREYRRTHPITPEQREENRRILRELIENSKKSKTGGNNYDDQ